MSVLVMPLISLFRMSSFSYWKLFPNQVCSHKSSQTLNTQPSWRGKSLDPPQIPWWRRQSPWCQQCPLVFGEESPDLQVLASTVEGTLPRVWFQASKLASLDAKLGKKAHSAWIMWPWVMWPVTSWGQRRPWLARPGLPSLLVPLNFAADHQGQRMPERIEVV